MVPSIADCPKSQTLSGTGHTDTAGGGGSDHGVGSVPGRGHRQLRPHGAVWDVATGRPIGQLAADRRIYRLRT
jgi:hypothetical protein